MLALRSSLSFCGSMPRRMSILRWSSTDMPGMGVLADAVNGDCDGASPAKGDDDEPALVVTGGCSEASFMADAAIGGRGARAESVRMKEGSVSGATAPVGGVATAQLPGPFGERCRWVEGEMRWDGPGGRGGGGLMLLVGLLWFISISRD